MAITDEADGGSRGQVKIDIQVLYLSFKDIQYRPFSSPQSRL